MQTTTFVLMIELAQHIEALLLENDCVIIPDFGGFITHYTVSSWNEKEGLFFPPVRSIGFNPQLKLNDGILIQSYMTVYDTNFSDATRKVESEVEKLSEQLYNEGKVELPNIGELRCNIHQKYEFTPFDHKLTTPRLYGLDAFEMQKLTALQPATPATTPVIKPRRSRRRYRINYSYLGNIAAMIAIVALFFFISTPVENTYIERNNYAQLMHLDLLEKIEKQSVVFTQIPGNLLAPKKSASSEVTTSKVQPVREEPTKENNTPPVPQKETASPASKASANYHIIVAGGVMQKNAEALVSQLKQKGYANACVLNCKGLIRVSLIAYTTETEATNQMLKLREKEEFKNAWLLTNK